MQGCFELQELKGKGLSAVARRHFEPGEKIYSEAPFCLIDEELCPEALEHFSEDGRIVRTQFLYCQTFANGITFFKFENNVCCILR